jgi:hypothetical protein
MSSNSQSSWDSRVQGQYGSSRIQESWLDTDPEFSRQIRDPKSPQLDI